MPGHKGRALLGFEAFDITEISGADSAARIIQAETDVKLLALDMAMSEGSYFEAMYRNINTLKEALE